MWRTPEHVASFLPCRSIVDEIFTFCGLVCFSKVEASMWPRSFHNDIAGGMLTGVMESNVRCSRLVALVHSAWFLWLGAPVFYQPPHQSVTRIFHHSDTMEAASCAKHCITKKSLTLPVHLNYISSHLYHGKKSSQSFSVSCIYHRTTNTVVNRRPNMPSIQQAPLQPHSFNSFTQSRTCSQYIHTSSFCV